MRVIRAGVKPAFGIFVIAHGLVHAALPVREAFTPASLALDFVPLILLGVAMIGFSTAGLGVFGVWPFSLLMQPAMVLASAYSLVLMWRLGQSDLWFGAAIDLGLFVIGLTAAYRYLPEVHAAPATRVATPASARG